MVARIISKNQVFKGGASAPLSPATVTRIQWFVVATGGDTGLVYVKITASAPSTNDGMPAGPPNCTFQFGNGDGNAPENETGSFDNNFDGSSLYYTFSFSPVFDQDVLNRFTVNSWGNVVLTGATNPATGHLFTPGDGVMDAVADPTLEF
jgi:hypothetical protein